MVAEGYTPYRMEPILEVRSLSSFRNEFLHDFKVDSVTWLKAFRIMQHKKWILR